MISAIPAKRTPRPESTQAEISELLDYHEDGYLVWKCDRGAIKVGGKRAGTDNGFGYRRIKIGGRLQLEHRLIYTRFHGSCPAELDHKDRNTRNNLLSNLRPASGSQNSSNHARRTDSKQRFKGVSRKGRLFKAKIQARGVTEHLGYFTSEEDAATAYNFAAHCLHGEFAYFNEVPQTCALFTYTEAPGALPVAN